MVSDADVGGIATRAEQWTEFIGAHSTIHPGSALAAVDAACPVLPCSRIAWSCLTFAHARLLTQEPDLSAALGDALVAVSHALTVLAPSPAECTLHGLRIAWTVLEGRPTDPALEALGVRRAPVARREVTRLLADRGFHASPRWSTQSSVRTAGALVSASAPDPEAFETAVRRLWLGELTAESDLQSAAAAITLMWERAAQVWRTRAAAPTLRPRSPYAGRARFGAARTAGPTTPSSGRPLGEG